VTGGNGPPLLLLHGFPETHIAWRKVAPALALRHQLIIPDLPRYGASRPRAMTPRWTKRRVAAALIALMRALGHERFAIAGHDRGARAGYRLALDHPGTVTAFASIAVVPTLDVMQDVDFRFTRKNYHWFLLGQEEPLPEQLLSATPDAFIDRLLAAMGAEGHDVIELSAREAYRVAFRNAAVRYDMCEDYRAALDEDLMQDRHDRAARRKLNCPVLIVWPGAHTEEGLSGAIEIWRRWTDEVTGAATK
jgi:haloacetate dehalogenase